ncbi:MAG: valine--tRNA ligase, partial [Coxiellaceae bacterium]|nr:valine--tRNA ligase [Coxiellaceae bacterium]
NELPPSAKTVAGKLDIHIPLAGLIDKDAELARLQKEITKLEKERDKAAKKLDNPGFANKAPEHVIQQEKERLAEFQQTLEKLEAHQQRIQRL